MDTRLRQVQAAVLRVVGTEDVLVGHSLENDLKALKMVHLRCLDTSLLYPHPKKGRRSSLRHLVSMCVGVSMLVEKCMFLMAEGVFHF